MNASRVERSAIVLCEPASLLDPVAGRQTYMTTTTLETRTLAKGVIYQAWMNQQSWYEVRRSLNELYGLIE